jgi:hypothetical protein
MDSEKKCSNCLHSNYDGSEDAFICSIIVGFIGVGSPQHIVVKHNFGCNLHKPDPKLEIEPLTIVAVSGAEGFGGFFVSYKGKYHRITANLTRDFVPVFEED